MLTCVITQQQIYKRLSKQRATKWLEAQCMYVHNQSQETDAEMTGYTCI